MTAGLLIILELLPLVAGRGHDPQGVVMSTAFLCAMLFIWGVWPAIVCVGIASLAADLRAHKNWWKVLFNPAQYAISVGAAYLPIYFLHGPVSLEHSLPTLDRGDLVWIPLAWISYYVVNNVIVCCVLSYTDRLAGAPARRLRPRRPDVVLGHGDLAAHRRRGHALVARAAAAPDPAAAALLHRVDVARTRTRGGPRRPDRPAQPQHAPLRTRHGPGHLRARRRPVRPDADRHERLQARQRHAGTPGRRPAARRVRLAAARAGAPGRLRRPPRRRRVRDHRLRRRRTARARRRRAASARRSRTRSTSAGFRSRPRRPSASRCARRTARTAARCCAVPTSPCTPRRPTARASRSTRRRAT